MPDYALRAIFAFIDCDLYESTLEVLTRMWQAGLLTRGTVLAFDEIMDHNKLTEGELAAFHEFLIANPQPVEVLIGGWRCSAMQIGGFGAFRLLR